MIFLSITILTSVLIIISFKVFNILDVSVNQAITFNYLFGFIYGLVFREDNHSMNQVIDSDWLIPSIFIGFVFILGFFLFSKSAVKAGVSITAVSAKMSVIIPVMAGFLLFGDSISTLKVAGIGLALLSFYFIFKKGENERINYKYIILPLSLLLVSGLNDSLVKYMEHNYLTDNILLFLTFVFLSAFIFGLVFSLSNSKSRQNLISYKGVLGGFLLGTFNFWNAWAFIRSMNIFESSMLFPTVNVSVVSISAFAGLLFFKEKLKLINWIGIFMAVIAILLISLENGN
ncbi:MAG: hypothetical protein C0595_12630 [Marinilabiliales bacterium]|nr:MAG: hypothetical protein C0595_12630 [Marinilabiliales bacterium]